MRRGTLIGVLAACALCATVTAILYARVALSGGAPARAPLPVETTGYNEQTSYRRSASFLGIVTAGRKADLGFETGGMLENSPPRPGTALRRGDVIASLDTAALHARHAAAAAELEQARAELELAQLKARRQEELQVSGAVSRQAHDETRLQARALAARVRSISARLQTLDIELEKSRLLAPHDGLVAERYVQQGAVVGPGAPVIRLMETTAPEIHVGIPARRMADLSPGQQYPLLLRGEVVEATLLSIRPDVDPRTRTATAVLSLPPHAAGLDGEPATLQLEETVAARGGWLPLAALQEGARGMWIVLRVDNGVSPPVAVREAVEILEVRGDEAFVRGTLASGARIIAGGVHRVSPGSAVVDVGVN